MQNFCSLCHNFKFQRTRNKCEYFGVKLMALVLSKTSNGSSNLFFLKIVIIKKYGRAIEPKEVDM